MTSHVVPFGRAVHSYSLYGLSVDSDLQLPALQIERPQRADLMVHVGAPLDRPVATLHDALEEGMMVSWRHLDATWRLRYDAADAHVLEFEIDEAGTRIDVRTSVADSEGDVANVLMGAGLAAALALRRVPVFHASAVVIGGRAILVAGRSGAGKSTLTAALVAQGAALLSDDLAVLSLETSGVMVHPGARMLRVYPASLAALGGSVERARLKLRRVFTLRNPEDKHFLDPDDLPGGRASVAAPVAAVYLLNARLRSIRTPELVALPAHEAALALIEHLYGSPFRMAAPVEQLSWCGSLSARAPVIRVTAPDDLAAVTRTAAAILERTMRHGEFA